jgi:hypothetical protein
LGQRLNGIRLRLYPGHKGLRLRPFLRGVTVWGMRLLFSVVISEAHRAVCWSTLGIGALAFDALCLTFTLVD